MGLDSRQKTLSNTNDALTGIQPSRLLAIIALLGMLCNYLLVFAVFMMALEIRKLLENWRSLTPESCMADVSRKKLRMASGSVNVDALWYYQCRHCLRL